MSAPAISRPSPARGACARVAILSAALVFAWTAARIHYVFGGNWTALFCSGAASPTPPDLDTGTYRFEGPGYDGQFYRYAAHDPFPGKNYTRYMDEPQMRRRRLLVPLTAWLLALGQRASVDPAYIAVEMLFLALGSYWCARLFARRGRSPLWGLLFATLPGVIASFDRMLVDGPLAAIFAGFLLYCEQERWTRVWALAMLAALTRDTGLLLCAALVADRLAHRDWRRAAWFATSGLPAMAWYGYLAAVLPPDRAVSVLAFPGWGLVQRLFWFRADPNPYMQGLLRATDFLAVLGLACSIVIAVHWLRGRRLEPVTLCVAGFAALGLVLGSSGYMIEAFGFGRPVSPLLLWIMLEGVSRQTWSALAPPLLVSLSAGLGLASPLLAVLKGLAGR